MTTRAQPHRLPALPPHSHALPPSLPTPNFSLSALPALPSSFAPSSSAPLPAAAPLPSSSAPPSASARGNGLDYAVMRKEKAREEYKERRRLELLASGEVERTKRRKKNDTSMSENQKYHRRLKMNQDSAAAARHAQEVYVETLEKLVETTEAEKSILSIQALNLRAERDELLRRVASLQAQAGAPAGKGADEAGIKRVLELIEAGAHGAPTEYRHSTGVYPSPAM